LAKYENLASWFTIKKSIKSFRQIQRRCSKMSKKMSFPFAVSKICQRLLIGDSNFKWIFGEENQHDLLG